MPYSDWSRIPPEQIHQMMSLQNAWERNIPDTMSEFYAFSKKVIELAENEIKNGTELGHVLRHYTPEELIKKSMCMLFASKALISEYIGPVDRSSELVDRTCRVDCIPFACGFVTC